MVRGFILQPTYRIEAGSHRWVLRRKPASTRILRKTSSGSPDGPPSTWWVARPVTASVERWKPRRAPAVRRGR